MKESYGDGRAIRCRPRVMRAFTAWLKTQGVDVDAAEQTGLAQYEKIRDA